MRIPAAAPAPQGREGDFDVRHIVGVRAEKEGRVLNFQTSDETLKKNDAVIVNTENGPNVGIVATDSKAVPLHLLPTDIRRSSASAPTRTFARSSKTASSSATRGISASAASGSATSP